MSDSSEPTHAKRQVVIRCIRCDLQIPPDATKCPQCGIQIAPGTVEISAATDTTPAPTRVIKRQTTNSLLAPDASVLLRFMPLGETLSLPLKQPLMLGRGIDLTVETLLDLTDYGGEQHGISRQHCQLQRRGTRLYVTDLGSTNGTFHNGKRIPPHQDFAVAHGDRLILGSLHILVLFSSKD